MFPTLSRSSSCPSRSRDVPRQEELLDYPGNAPSKDEARRVPPRAGTGNGRRVNLLGIPTVQFLGRPIYMIEFKCRSLDTLSSGRRHFHVKPFDLWRDRLVPGVRER
jgi:hypothetical protein